jgi:hypothetical protein
MNVLCDQANKNCNMILNCLPFASSVYLIALFVCEFYDKAGTRGRQAWQLPRAQRLIIFLTTVNPHSVEYIFVIYQVKGVKLMMAKTFPWTAVLAVSSILQQNINFNYVIDEFAFVKARKLYSTLYNFNCTCKIMSCIFCYASSQ